jgi:hypothetical protein
MAFESRWRVFTVSVLAALTAACGAAEEDGAGREAPRAVPLPGAGASFPVGGRDIAGVAFGEGAVWVATWGARASSIWRIDSQCNEVVATIPVEDVPGGVAAGEGDVWVVGSTCVERHPEDADVCRVDSWVAPHRSSAGAGVLGRRPVTNRSTRRRVMSGASGASPAATTRTACTSRCCGSVFTRKPTATALSASWTFASRS